MKANAGMAVVMLALSGCASMSQNECLTGDWSRIGYVDGAAGHPPSRLSDHAKSCAAYGVRPDTDAYLAARERGLDVYCTPHRGFEAGRLGRQYHGVCPPRLARGFLAGYDDGLRVHAATEHREDVRSDVRRFDRRIDDIGDELEDIRDRLDDDKLTAQAREALQDARHDLRDDLHRARQNRERARRRERAASHHADTLRHVLSRRYGVW